ncbi:MAG: decaprenyl-phosphate phosphoribosyltransferase [Gammaproteobacteria bacterium]|nr:decaprenyl-phosphate phosphoribosyltransferase [Gammaproteobacteria bacterium]
MQLNVQTFQHAAASISNLRLLLISVRPTEWIKNAFLFAPLFFSKNLVSLELLAKTLLAFSLYCLATGGVYLINDIWDRDADKKHPQKSTRPIASGALPLALAAPVAIFLLITSLTGTFLLSLSFGLVTTGYVLLCIAYSQWLKQVVILDVFSIAAGFVLRVVAGAVVIGVAMSHWLLICTMLLALFLGFSKRRYELVALANDASLHRPVLAEYDPLFLDMMIAVVTSATVVGYALYTISNETIQRFNTDRLLLTLPFVLYGIFRYLYLVYHKNHGGNPSQTLLADGPLLVNIALWVLVAGAIIYTANP